MNYIKNNKGFSLIEVIAAVVILSIILLSFSQLLIQANKTANLNNEKLVVINLADGVLVKLQAKPIQKNDSYNYDEVQNYFNDASYEKEIALNGKKYTVSYVATQENSAHTNTTNTEVTLNLINVIVTVTSSNGKTKSSTEGYVSIE